LSGLVEECLKDVAVAMTCLDGEELSRAGADSPQDVETDVFAVVDDAKLRSLHGPASARLRFSVDSRLRTTALCPGLPQGETISQGTPRAASRPDGRARAEGL